MAALNLSVRATVKDESGEDVVLSHPQALQHRGPVAQVTASLSDAWARPIVRRGDPIPEPMSGYALIDTGASVTRIDCELAMKHLALPPLDKVDLVSASDKTEKNVFAVKFEIAGLPMAINVNRVVGAEQKDQGIIVLIGQDLLQHCVLCYNRISGGVTLAI